MIIIINVFICNVLRHSDWPFVLYVNSDECSLKSFFYF
jgi:hypothetical protein